MVIYNKTKQIQELRVQDFYTKRAYSIYVGAESSVELAPGLSTIGLDALVSRGIFSILGREKTPVVPQDLPEIKKDAEVPADSESKESEDSESEESEDTTLVEDEIPEGDSEESDEDSVGDSDEEDLGEEEESSEFICDICGGEFASSRGLANHKSRAHNN